mgnify:CR=1 FL=1
MGLFIYIYIYRALLVLKRLNRCLRSYFQNSLKKHGKLCLTSMLLFSFSALATVPLQTPNQRNYTVTQGLSQSTVYKIIEDRQGFIWLATQRGIDRFDGYQFISFGQNDDASKGLPASFVNDIEIDKSSDNIWVATLNGLTLLDVKTSTFSPFTLLNKDSQHDKVVNAVHSANSGITWVGTQQGLYKRKGNGEFESQHYAEDEVSIADIEQLNSGHLILATNLGLKLFDPDTGEWQTLVESNTFFTSVLIDSEGNIWAGTSGSGLFHIDGGSMTNESIEESMTDSIKLQQFSNEEGLADSIVNDIKQFSDGSIWVATTNGISIFPKATQFDMIDHSTVNQKNDNQTSMIQSLFQNKDGFVFYGTLSTGFFVIDPNSVLFSRILVDNKNVTYAVALENERSMWVAGEDGLFNVDEHQQIVGPIKHSSEKMQNDGNKVTSLIYSAKSRSLWAGSRKGLSKLNPNTRELESVAYDNFFIYTINEDEFGNLWLGTRGNGLIKYDPVNNQSLARWDMPLVLRTVEASDKKIWVASIDGLYLIDPNTDSLTRYTSDLNDPTALPFDVVTWISEIGSNDYVVGTQSKGLARMSFSEDDSRPYFEPLFTDSRISSLSIGAVVKGVNDHYWVSTTEGLARINADFSEIMYFDENDGANASGYFIGGFDTNSEGQIFLAGAEGLTYFHPEQIEVAQNFPALYFTKLGALDQNNNAMQVLIPAKLSAAERTFVIPDLPHDNLALNIEFAALEFGNPTTIAYRYKLEGFHNSWQQSDSNMRSISFTNLDSGQYELKVKSNNRYGKWNEDYFSLKFNVLAPWWNSPWAILLFAVLSLLILYSIYRWRTYSLHLTSLKLTRMVEAQTKDLEAANEKLKTLLNLDPLTNAYNRRGFKELANKEFSKYERHKTVFSILLIDIDDFKRVNDGYGHDIGDQSLLFVTQQLSTTLRSHDILARWGGEEFIVLLPETDRREAANTAEKLRLGIANAKLSIPSATIDLTVSIGVAEISGFDSIEACIKNADERLYQAKHDGRNRIVY